jgi:glycosyltransferase involved in cell wall biosynthesis
MALGSPLWPHGWWYSRGSAGRHHWAPGTISRSQALADAVRYLLCHPEHVKAFGRAGRQRVEHYFTVEQMVCRTLEVYERVLADAPV